MENRRILPGYSNYEVTPEGRVFNKATGRWLGDNRTGYVSLHLKGDDGNILNIPRHRLVAKLFVDKVDESHNVVNHLNGIKGDDRPENLEWTTDRGNIEHAGAHGLTSKCIPINVRNAATGEVSSYPSAIEAGKAFGLTRDAVLWRLQMGCERVGPDNLQFKKQTDASPWPVNVSHEFSRSVPIYLRDIETRRVEYFKQQSGVAEKLNVSLACINTHASSGEQRLINGRYQIKLETDPNPWREITDPLMENKVKRPVIVTKNSDGSEQVFASAKDCADAMGLLTTTLNERLKHSNNRVCKDGYRYRYY